MWNRPASGLYQQTASNILNSRDGNRLPGSFGHQEYSEPYEDIMSYGNSKKGYTMLILKDTASRVVESKTNQAQIYERSINSLVQNILGSKEEDLGKNMFKKQ